MTGEKKGVYYCMTNYLLSTEGKTPLVVTETKLREMLPISPDSFDLQIAIKIAMGKAVILNVKGVKVKIEKANA